MFWGPAATVAVEPNTKPSVAQTINTLVLMTIPVTFPAVKAHPAMANINLVAA